MSGPINDITAKLGGEGASHANATEPFATPCLTDAEMLAFATRQETSGRTRVELEAHIASCEECRVLLSALASSESMFPAAAALGLANTAVAPITTRTSGPTSTDSETTSLIAGRYQLGQLLGVGGMGRVFAGEHKELRQPCAIKFLHGPLVSDDEARARFLREAQTVARLQSEHIVRVHDSGTWQGAPFFVMELLRGQTLRAALATRSRLPLDICAEYILQALSALAEAHRAGIVHRDLKPDNLFLHQRTDGSEILKVVDFGLTKLLAEDGPGLTATHVVMGTPRYMAPEQLRRTRDVDARADIWAIGCILHECLAGSPPFDGESLSDLIVRVSTEPHVPLQTIRPDLPRDVTDVIDRCLTKDREQRMPTVADLARVIASWTPAGPRLLQTIEALSGAAGGQGHTPALATPNAHTARLHRSSQPAPAAAMHPSAHTVANVRTQMVGHPAPSSPAALGLSPPPGQGQGSDRRAAWLTLGLTATVAVCALGLGIAAYPRLQQRSSGAVAADPLRDTKPLAGANSGETHASARVPSDEPLPSIPTTATALPMNGQPPIAGGSAMKPLSKAPTSRATAALPATVTTSMGAPTASAKAAGSSDLDGLRTRN
jgi:serine/threonine protein kinase